MKLKIPFEEIANRNYEGESVPKGYGIAWEDYLMRYVIYYPIPLNVIMRVGRQIFFWVAYHRGADFLTRAYRNGQDDAQIEYNAKLIKKGYHQGYADAKYLFGGDNPERWDSL